MRGHLFHLRSFRRNLEVKQIICVYKTSKNCKSVHTYKHYNISELSSAIYYNVDNLDFSQYPLAYLTSSVGKRQVYYIDVILAFYLQEYLLPGEGQASFLNLQYVSAPRLQKLCFSIAGRQRYILCDYIPTPSLFSGFLKDTILNHGYQFPLQCLFT